jgi:hypothetical protein
MLNYCPRVARSSRISKRVRNDPYSVSQSQTTIFLCVFSSTSLGTAIHILTSGTPRQVLELHLKHEFI